MGQQSFVFYIDLRHQGLEQDTAFVPLPTVGWVCVVSFSMRLTHEIDGGGCWPELFNDFFQVKHFIWWFLFIFLALTSTFWIIIMDYLVI